MEYVEVSGTRVPSIGLGTGQLVGSECRRTVKTALELGYRRFDTSQMYSNEDVVGDAIQGFDVERDDVFIETKLNRSLFDSVGYAVSTGKPLRTGVRLGCLRADRVLESVEGSLDRLKTDYVDLLSIHAPSLLIPLRTTLQAMNTLYRENKVRYLGVSNFTAGGLRRATRLSDAPILSNQVKYNVYYSQDELPGVCEEMGVVLTAYSPLNHGKRLEHDVLVDVGEKHGKTPAQVALRWLVQQPNVTAIPRSSCSKHLKQNLDIFDFELTEQEMERLRGVRGGLVERLRNELRV